MMVKRMTSKDQLRKVSCEAGTAHRLKMKRRGKLAKMGPNGSIVGGRAKIGGDLGTKKDGRKFLAVGGYAKST